MRGEERVEARHRPRPVAVELAVGAEDGDGVRDLRVARAEAPLERVDEVDQVDDRALAEAEPAMGHGEPLLEHVIGHHDLGGRGGFAVGMQRARAAHELRLVVAERAARLAADGEPPEESRHRPLRAPEQVDRRRRHFALSVPASRNPNMQLRSPGSRRSR